jgi:hypothetical protein
LRPYRSPLVNNSGISRAPNSRLYFDRLEYLVVNYFSKIMFKTSKQTYQSKERR